MTDKVDALLLQAIVEIIRKDAKAKGVDDNLIEALAREAILDDRLEDPDWLALKLEELTQIKVQKDQMKQSFEVLDRIKVSKQAFLETEEDFKKILAEHSKWITGVLSPDEVFAQGRANLRGCDLSKFDLRGVNLSCADLREANLQGVNLAGANLSKARLQKANLRNANLTKANLKRAHLEKTDLRDAILDDLIVFADDLKPAFLREYDVGQC